MSEYFEFSPRTSQLCGRCTLERLDGCGAGGSYPECMEPKKPMREFASGATRNTDGNKPDPDGFISPLVLQRYCDYMHQHRVQADGTLRASDNWQKGIPTEAYRKSLNRHHLHAWLLGRGYEAYDYDTGELVLLEESLCAILFNTMGWLHEVLSARGDE